MIYVIEDNIGLCHVLASGFPVMPIFIFDTSILNTLESKNDRRVEYTHQTLPTINLELKKIILGYIRFMENP